MAEITMNYNFCDDRDVCDTCENSNNAVTLNKAIIEAVNTAFPTHKISINCTCNREAYTISVTLPQ